MSEQVHLKLPESTTVHWCNLFDEAPTGLEKDIIFITLPNGFVLDADEVDGDDIWFNDPHYVCSVVYPKEWRDEWCVVVTAAVKTMPQLVAVLEAWAVMDWPTLAPREQASVKP